MRRQQEDLAAHFNLKRALEANFEEHMVLCNKEEETEKTRKAQENMNLLLSNKNKKYFFLSNKNKKYFFVEKS